MVNQKTIEFVNENRGLLRKLAKHGDPAIRPMAAAFLAAVPPEGSENSEEDKK